MDAVLLGAKRLQLAGRRKGNEGQTIVSKSDRFIPLRLPSVQCTVQLETVLRQPQWASAIIKRD